jgi:hypothetical protein
MSGSGANLPINIRVTGTQEAEAAFNRVQTAAGTSMQRVQQSTAQAGAEGGRFGQVIGQAGFQVQDFATQVSMGQNALQAFGVQFAQFAGVFGTGGAIAGAVVVAGTLAAQMVGLGSATDTLSAAVKDVGEGYDRLNDAAERRARGMRDEAEAVARLADEYRGMGLAAARAESLLVERRGAALDLEAGRMREALQGSLSDSVLRRLNPPDASRGSEFGLGDMGLARADEQLTALADIFARVGSQAGQTQQNIRELAAEADRLAQAGGTSAQSFVRLRDAALDMLPAASQLDAAQRQIAVQTVAAAQAMGNSEEVIGRYAARFGTLAAEIMRAGQSLNALRQGGIGIAEDRIASEIRRNEATLAALRGGGIEAGTAARDAGTREEQILRRASELSAAARREMEAALVPLDQIQENLREGQAEFVALATRAVDSGRAVEAGLRPARDAARGNAAAVRDIAEAYADLRRDAGTGLLLVSDADARAAREIAAQLRPGQQERARAAAEAQRDQDRVLQEQERANRQVTDSIVRYGADRFADMFAENSRGWAGMLDTFRSTFRSLMARIAAEAIIRPIIAPIVQGLGLGQLSSGNISGLFGGGQAQAAQPAAQGGGMSAADLGSFSTLRTAYNGLTSPGGLGPMFPGGMGFNTGFGGIDGVLNAQLVAPAGLDAATNSALGAMGGQFGPATPGAIMGAGASPGLTIGSVLGPGLAIAGGAYGVYSGLQRGGIGGYTSAAGGAISAATGIGMLGAAAGLLPALGVLGPIGLALGAALAIAGALMPGAKPSSMGQEARIELATGDLTRRGLGGDRYSAGNASQAEAAVQSISDLARNLSAQLGGLSLGDQAAAVGVTRNTLYLDAVGQKAQFANNEEGAKQLADTAARFLINAFTDAEARAVAARGQGGSDQLGILMNSGGSLEALSQNLQWYEQVYKGLTKTGEAAAAFTLALEASAKPYDDAIAKARSLGVAEAGLTAKRDEARAKLIAQRDAEFADLSAGIASRGIAAGAFGGDRGELIY